MLLVMRDKTIEEWMENPVQNMCCRIPVIPKILGTSCFWICNPNWLRQGQKEALAVEDSSHVKDAHIFWNSPPEYELFSCLMCDPCTTYNKPLKESLITLWITLQMCSKQKRLSQFAKAKHMETVHTLLSSTGPEHKRIIICTAWKSEGKGVLIQKTVFLLGRIPVIYLSTESMNKIQEEHSTKE